MTDALTQYYLFLFSETGRYIAPVAIGAFSAFLVCVAYDIFRMLRSPKRLAMANEERRKRWVKEFAACLITEAFEEAYVKGRWKRSEVNEMYNFIGTRCKGMSSLLPTRYADKFPNADELIEAIRKRIRRKRGPRNRIEAILFKHKFNK